MPARKGSPRYEESLLRRDRDLLQMKDCFSASERDAFLSIERPDELIAYDDLAIMDPEDICVASKSIEDHMAELQNLIGAYEDGDDLLVQSGPRSRSDPLKLLEAQCEAMREELREATKAKQDVEYELGQNVYKLQMRIQSQHAEKSVLTERLQEAKMKVDRKAQEMLLKEKDLSEKISVERAKHERVAADMTQHLGILQDRFAELNQQVQKQWEVQVDLIKQLDQKNDEAAKVRAELHEERVRSWQQNDHLMPSEHPDGTAIKSSIRTAYGVEQPSMGTPQWRSQEECDKQIEELRRRLDRDKQELHRKQHDLLESRKHCVLQLEQKKKAIVDKSQQLKVVREHTVQLQRYSDSLKKSLQSIAERAGKQQLSPLRSLRTNSLALQATRDSPGNSFSNDSKERPPMGSQVSELRNNTLANTGRRTKTELAEARDAADAIKNIAVQLEAQKLQLSELQKQMDLGADAESQMNDCHGKLVAAEKELSDLQKLRQEKDEEKKQALNELQEMQAKQSDIQAEQKDLFRIETLRKQKQTKEQDLDRLRRENNQHEDELARQGKCCVRPKAKAAAPQRPIPTDTSSASMQRQNQPSQPSQTIGKQSLDNSKGKGDGKGDGKGKGVSRGASMTSPPFQRQQAPVEVYSNPDTRASSSAEVPRDSNAQGMSSASRENGRAPKSSTEGSQRHRESSSREKSGRSSSRGQARGESVAASVGGPSSSSSAQDPPQRQPPTQTATSVGTDITPAPQAAPPVTTQPVPQPAAQTHTTLPSVKMQASQPREVEDNVPDNDRI